MKNENEKKNPAASCYLVYYSVIMKKENADACRMLKIKISVKVQKKKNTPSDLVTDIFMLDLH